MLIGEAGAVTDLWEAARKKLPRPRLDRPGQPVYAIADPPPAGEPGCGRRPSPTSTCSCPRVRQPTTRSSASTRCGAIPSGFRWRTRTQIEEGRSWLWAEDGVIRFKAEASAWTPSAVQLQQVWTDPPARRQGFAGQGAPRPDQAAPRGHADRLPVRPGGERRCDQALRVGRDAPRARLPLRPPVKTLILARHAHSVSNVGDTVNGVPPGLGLSPEGSEQARALGASSSPSRSTSASARASAHAGDARSRPRRARIPMPSSSRFSTRSGSARSRAARSPTTAPGRGRTGRVQPCPGGGETRADIAARLADGPRGAAAAARRNRSRGQPRPPRPVRARRRRRPRPAARPEHVPHATPYRLERAAVERAAETLGHWAAAPYFADTPIGG